MAVGFTINGNETSVDVERQMPLLWALRDHLRLTGTKYGCGIGKCGACAVLIDGELGYACVTPVATVDGSRIETIEGLSGDVPAMVQKAWIAHDVAQCGYCQSGQVVAATALLAEHPKPTDHDIDTAMAGQLCRCATYQRVRAAIHSASAELGEE